jgi:PPOX class probable F420-dependent enzyme
MSATTDPVTTLVREFSAPNARPTPWEEARDRLEAAELYWITTVRADGRPHVTPLIGVWWDGALHFCTGGHEQKARNIEANPRVILTTGSNEWNRGLDVVLEGEARRLQDEDPLRRVAEAYVAKYGEEWRFDVRDGAFVHSEDRVALVFRVEPEKVLGFRKGDFAQTRWRFGVARV